MQNALARWAKERGYKVAWGPVAAIHNARTRILDRYYAGKLDHGFYAAELETIVEGESLPAEGSVVIVAVPRPAHKLGFQVNGSRFDAILPPTYFRYRATFENVRQDLSENGLPGASVAFLPAPSKSLAAILGLVRYGRNNVTYADGIGSFLQLCGYTTDADLSDQGAAQIQEPQLLPECEGCTRCQMACPTDAIGEDQVLIRAHRCLTYANENTGDWPDHVPSKAHHCLLGCLRCQRACPANPKLNIEDTGLCFSAEETNTLLGTERPASDRTEDGIRTKLAWLGQPDAEEVLGRNLRALLDAKNEQKKSPTQLTRRGS